ncbi:MAG: aldehyde dehydrogenase family protein, partial [Candidatus Binatia bacterium]
MAKLLIGGEQVESGSKETYEVRNPATGEVVDRAAKGTAKDVMQAIDAAETA